jgi:hypothetical protein
VPAGAASAVYLSASAARENFAQKAVSPLHRAVSRRYDFTPFDENALLRRFPEKFSLTSSKLGVDGSSKGCRMGGSPGTKCFGAIFKRRLQVIDL